MTVIESFVWGLLGFAHELVDDSKQERWESWFKGRQYLHEWW